MVFKRILQEYLDKIRNFHPGNPDRKSINNIFKVILATNIIGTFIMIKNSDSNSKYEISLTRGCSRLYGHFFNWQIPESYREFLFNGYSWLFTVDPSTLDQPLSSYPTLNSFFTRKLKPGSRPIDSSALISPCDGKITSFGVASGKIESVKGVDYSFSQFLTGDQLDFSTYRDSLISNKSNELYYVTIYLAPGDYHRFHSPCDWDLVFRRHIFGYLQGVFKWNLIRKREVFSTNERVAYFGKWKYGALHYVAVAAFNVGDVQVMCDPGLKTNISSFEDPFTRAKEERFTEKLEKGQEFGFFAAGSTVVIVFEAPRNIQWAVKQGDKVQLGNKLVLGL